MLQAIIFKETISRIEAFTNEQGLQTGTLQTPYERVPSGTDESDRAAVTGTARAEHVLATSPPLQTETLDQHTTMFGASAPAANRSPALIAPLQSPAAEHQQPAPDTTEAKRSASDPDGGVLLGAAQRKTDLVGPVSASGVQAQHLGADAAAASGGTTDWMGDMGQETLVIDKAAHAAILPGDAAHSSQDRGDVEGKVQAGVGEDEGQEHGEGEDDSETLQKTVAALAMGSDAIARYGLVLQPGADRQGK